MVAALSSAAAFATLLLLSPLPAVESTPFTCKVTATCVSLLGYTPPYPTTYAAAAALFDSPVVSLLTTNNLPPSTSPSSAAIPANATVRVSIPCSCVNSTGAAAPAPIYTIHPGDTLDTVAQRTFAKLVTFQDIAAANGIADPDKIEAGQNVSIPLPCSCDQVVADPVVHLAHVVAPGSTVDGIAAEFGTTDKELMAINGITNPKDLLAYQILDVPLRACSSSISSTAIDHLLRVPNDSYALTANGCILCNCSAPSYKLQCYSTQSLSSTKCPVATCLGQSLGKTSAAGCELSTCTYAGYTNNGPSITILTANDTQNTCTGPTASPGIRLSIGIALRIVLLGIGFM